MMENFDQKRILLCTSTTIPFNAGDGKNAFNFAKSLLKHNQKPAILSLNKSLIYPWKSVLNNIPIFRAPYFNRNFIEKLLSRFIIIPYFFYFVLKNEIIIIYGKIIAYSFLILLAKMFRRKVIFRSTLYGFDDFTSLINDKNKKAFRKFFLGFIDYYYALTPAFSEAFSKYFYQGDKLFESCQGVDLSVFHPVDIYEKKQLRKKIGLPENKIIIISVGFLLKRKGFDEIFETLSRVKKPFLYVVIGDYDASSGVLRKKEREMQKLYKKGNSLLKDKILFTGSKENVFEYLQASDILLMNSFREGLSNVLLEGMASGLAVTVREIPGITNYIVFPDKTAEVFSTPDEMEDKINRLIDKDQLRTNISKNASNYILKNCRIEDVTKRFLKKIFHVI